MRLITHNMLQCHKKSCASGKNYPLLLQSIEVESKEVEFNPEFLVNFIPRLDWSVVHSVAQQLSLPVSIPEQLPETPLDMEKDEELLKNLHTILMETHLKNGELKCPGCQRSYQISDGIANMLLNEDEI